MTVCSTFKISKCEIFYNPDDLENKIKVKQIAGNKMSCHYAS